LLEEPLELDEPAVSVVPDELLEDPESLFDDDEEDESESRLDEESEPESLLSPFEPLFAPDFEDRLSVL
jgi:hypothetical protein